jgi:hypothetical protein
MEATDSSETLLNCYQTARCHVQEDAVLTVAAIRNSDSRIQILEYLDLG